MGLAPDPDAQLMLRVQRGDRDAFAMLMDRHGPAVFNLAARTLSDAVEAEDITQAVFVQVWKSAPRYRPTAPFRTWLFTIARNLCLNELRRRARHPAEPLEPSRDECDSAAQLPVDPTAPPPTEALLRTELEDKIEEALAALPENQRTALLLCRQGDWSYEDIAEVLGCSLSATKSLIFRARETLKRRLKPYLRTGEWPS
ncbi:MAG: sigma-70 family RNA polymerase sigma factor [Verrucomicrobiota bacterium]|nr:sigma-70 family RNA polymerase sigma factor [Limisphaera sp.]MDW8382816.1 sigma-70 family RNA polymerase sigma factor [Verrucomicrobiota bacterium]